MPTYISPLPSDTTLSEARVQALLAQGHEVAITVGERQSVVHFDGTYYRAGVCRAKTLEGLKALLARAVR